MAWLDDVIIFFGCILEVFLIYDYFSNFFELKVDKRHIKTIAVSTCLLLFGINMIKNSYVNLICFPLLMWIFVSVLFEGKTGIRLGYFISAYVIMIGVEFLYIILSDTTLSMLGKTGVPDANDFGWQGIFVKFLNYIIFLLCKQTSGKSHSKMDNKLFYIYMLVPVSTLGTMITVFYSGVEYRGNTVLRTILTMFFIFMVVGNIVLFYAFQKHTEEVNEFARKEIELSNKNAEIDRLTKITELNDEYNETVHNMTHSLKLIEQLARENKVNDIIDAVESMTGKLVKRNAYEYSNCKILNTILSEYSDKAAGIRIKFDVYVEPGCIVEQIKDIDLVSMVGNILDNAFEAASKVDDSSVVFRMFMHEKGKMCMIKVINDYDGELKEIDGKLQSTKKEAGIHGIGISSITRSAEKYNGVYCYYTENNKFHASLILPV